MTENALSKWASAVRDSVAVVHNSDAEAVAGNTAFANVPANTVTASGLHAGSIVTMTAGGGDAAGDIKIPILKYVIANTAAVSVDDTTAEVSSAAVDDVDFDNHSSAILVINNILTTMIIVGMVIFITMDITPSR